MADAIAIAIVGVQSGVVEHKHTCYTYSIFFKPIPTESGI